MSDDLKLPEWGDFHSWVAANPELGAHAEIFLRGALARVSSSALSPKSQSAKDEPLAKTVLDLGVYLRERDFFSLRIEEWGARPAGEGKQPLVKVACIPFEGEIPCLYSIQRVRPKGRYRVPSVIVPQVLALVDRLSPMTGAGLGVRICLTPSLEGIPSGIRVDPRTGRRMRYKITSYPDPEGDRTHCLCWIERSETGRGRGHGPGPLPMF